MPKICMDCKYYTGWKCTKEVISIDYISGYIIYPDINTFRETKCGIEEAKFFEPRDTSMVNRIRNYLKENFGV